MAPLHDAVAGRLVGADQDQEVSWLRYLRLILAQNMMFVSCLLAAACESLVSDCN